MKDETISHLVGSSTSEVRALGMARAKSALSVLATWGRPWPQTSPPPDIG